jgi:hypothetical protein
MADLTPAPAHALRPSDRRSPSAGRRPVCSSSGRASAGRSRQRGATIRKSSAAI